MQPEVFDVQWKTYKRNEEIRKGTVDDGFSDLWSKYRVHEIDIRIKDPQNPMLRPLGLPEGASFTTVQGGGQHSVFGHRQHAWSWQEISETGYVPRNNEDYSEMTINLQKKELSDKLGVGWRKCEEDSEQGVMLIGELAKEGLMPKWNEDNPHMCFNVGDRIVEVNGVRGGFDTLVAELQKSLSLNMLVSREAKHDIDPTQSINLQSDFRSFGYPARDDQQAAPNVSGDASRVLVLDCGSGSTRGSIYSITDDGSLSEDHLPHKLDPIHLVIPGGADKIKAFLDQLSKELDDQGKRPVSVLLGACGGVRDAIEAGKITSDMLTEFQKALNSHEGLGCRGELKVLTGEDEAQAEHKAVQYMAKQVLPSLAQPVGLISSGGTSSQIVYFPDQSDDGAVKQFSLHTNFKQQQLKIIEVGVEEGLKSLDNYLEELLNTNCPTLLGQLQGIFCCIETMGQIGEITEVGHKLVSKQEAVDAITRCLEEYKVKSKGIDPKAAGWTYKETFRGAMPVLALRLLSLLHPSAQLYFADTWKIAPGRTMQAVVPLGLYLEQVGF